MTDETIFATALEKPDAISKAVIPATTRVSAH